MALIFQQEAWSAICFVELQLIVKTRLFQEAVVMLARCSVLYAMCLTLLLIKADVSFMLKIVEQIS